MEDIAPKMYEQIKKDFDRRISNSKKLSDLLEKLIKGTATYKEAHEFAIESGEIISQVFQKNISSSVLPEGRLYYNIADRIIRPMMSDLYEGVADYAKEVQAFLNKQQNIGIKAIRPKLNEDKVQGILDITSGKEYFDDIAYMLGEPVVNFSQTIVDDTVRANADFQYKAGLSPKIVRITSGKCCKWCDKLAGVYDYEKVSDTGNNVFRRHKHCECLVEYAPGDGTKQNVHTKKWSKADESDKIKAREKEERIKRENNLGFADKIASHPKILQAYTPERLKETLENAGYDVKPLNKGSLKGKLFEDGGGFKVNFGGDGILQYHPEKKSHHSGEYYKISTGKGGTKRYDLKGNEKED